MTPAVRASIWASPFLVAGLVTLWPNLVDAQSSPPVRPADSSMQRLYDSAFQFQTQGDLVQANKDYLLFLAAALHRIANGRANLGDYAHAAPLFEQAARLTPNDRDLQVDFAGAALDAADWKTAKAMAASVLTALEHNSRPPDVRAVSVLARALSDLEEHQAALEQFKLAAHLRPDFDTFSQLAIAFLTVGDTANAEKILAEIPARFGDTASLHLKLGIVYGQTKLFDRAVDEFTKALDRDSRLKGAHYSLGATYMMQSGGAGYDKAEAEFRKELELDPANALVYAPLGGIFMDRHRYAQAEASLKRAIALDQQTTSIYLSLGQICMQTGRTADAESALRKAIALSPDPAKNDYEVERAHYWLGRLLMGDGAAEQAHRELDTSRNLLYLKEQRTESRMGGGAFVAAPLAITHASSPAAQAAERALEKQAGSLIASSYDNLGVNAANAGDYGAASSYFEQAAHWNPSLPGIDDNWGRAAFAARKYDRAVEPFNRILKLHPADQHVRAMLGLSLCMVQKYMETLQVLRPMEDKVQMNPDLAMAYAASTAMAGDYSQGVARLESLQSANPSAALVHLLLGQVYASKEEFSRSANELHIAVDIDPANNEARNALALADVALGRNEEALQLLSALVNTGSQSGDLYYRLASLQLELALTGDAVKNLETAVRLCPFNLLYHQQLQKAYRLNAQPEEADREMHRSQLLEAQAQSSE